MYWLIFAGTKEMHLFACFD